MPSGPDVQRGGKGHHNRDLVRPYASNIGINGLDRVVEILAEIHDTTTGEKGD